MKVIRQKKNCLDAAGVRALFSSKRRPCSCFRCSGGFYRRFFGGLAALFRADRPRVRSIARSLLKRFLDRISPGSLRLLVRYVCWFAASVGPGRCSSETERNLCVTRSSWRRRNARTRKRSVYALGSALTLLGDSFFLGILDEAIFSVALDPRWLPRSTRCTIGTVGLFRCYPRHLGYCCTTCPSSCRLLVV